MAVWENNRWLNFSKKSKSRFPVVAQKLFCLAYFSSTALKLAHGRAKQILIIDGSTHLSLYFVNLYTVKFTAEKCMCKAYSAWNYTTLWTNGFCVLHSICARMQMYNCCSFSSPIDGSLGVVVPRCLSIRSLKVMAQKRVNISCSLGMWIKSITAYETNVWSHKMILVGCKGC